ncbi:MAG: hypothetical protein ACFHWX_03180 [Bacteroidota bacterium]
MEQSWFEMKDLKKRKLNYSIWVPLRSIKPIQNETRFGKVGYSEEFLGHGSIAVPINLKKKAFKHSWTDVGISQFHQGKQTHEDDYLPADIYRTEGFEAINLILHQTYNNLDVDEWHLHQDLVTTLGLLRENDSWVCPADGYIEVVRLERDPEESPIHIEIRNQYLKEYLKLRKCGLYITAYYSRDVIEDNTEFLSWDDDSKQEINKKDSWEWECRIMPIHEGGHLFGEKIAVSHVSRTDIEGDEDIPDISSFPTEENTKSEFYKKEFTGRKLYRVMAELWKKDWIEPATDIVDSEEELEEKIFFIVDEEGNKKSGISLTNGGRWLWFEPNVVNSLLSKRGSHLYWYTKETGSVACSPDWSIHFGINDLGLVTVYAKDIGNLPSWQQQIWAGHNVPPEGGISKELHSSQVRAEPASTLAPENFFSKAINELNEVGNDTFGISIFRKHEATDEIIRKIHRFKAINLNGLLSLTKDIARVIIDDMDAQAIQTIVLPPKGTKWGSLKSLENLLSIKIKPEYSRKILSPLVGVYELRHGDAHLPTSQLQNSFKLLEINTNQPTIIQGYQILNSCVDSLYTMKSIFQDWNKYT